MTRGGEIFSSDGSAADGVNAPARPVIGPALRHIPFWEQALRMQSWWNEGSRMRSHKRDIGIYSAEFAQRMLVAYGTPVPSGLRPLTGLACDLRIPTNDYAVFVGDLFELTPLRVAAA